LCTFGGENSREKFLTFYPKKSIINPSGRTPLFICKKLIVINSMSQKNVKRGEVVIYKTSKNEVELKVHFKEESVWLRQNEIALLFGKERSVITKHINKIFTDKEVNEKSNVQKMHIAKSDKPVEFYSLDVILAVGYRANSSRAIHFRKWATKTLKQYLIQGYAINKKRLSEVQNKFHDLQETVLFLQKQSQKELLQGQGTEILNLLADYSKTLSVLEQYDSGTLTEKKGKKQNMSYGINPV